MSGPVRRGLVLGLVAGIGGLGIGAPGVVLPTVADALDVTEDATAWVLAAFVLGSAVASTNGGRAIDLIGAGRVAAAGAAAVLAGTALVLVAGSLPAVVAARFVQGVGSGWLCVVAFSAVSHVPEPGRERTGGVLTATSFTMIASSPLVGALVESLAGWRPALALAALGVLPMPAVLRGLPTARRATGSLDLAGAGWATVAALGLAAVLQAPATGMSVLAALGAAATATAATVVLARHLGRRPDGFLPVAILRNRELLRLSAIAATIQAAYTGLIFAAPLLLDDAVGWSGLQTGAALFPGAALAAGAAYAAGTVGRGRSTRRLLLPLCATSAAAAAVVALGSGAAAAIVVGTVVAIAPYAAAQALMLGRIAALVPAELVGAATGTFAYVFITGGALGAALAGGVGAATSLAAAVGALVALPLLGALAARRRPAAAPVEPALAPARAVPPA